MEEQYLVYNGIENDYIFAETIEEAESIVLDIIKPEGEENYHNDYEMVKIYKLYEEVELRCNIPIRKASYKHNFTKV